MPLPGRFTRIRVRHNQLAHSRRHQADAVFMNLDFPERDAHRCLQVLAWQPD